MGRREGVGLEPSLGTWLSRSRLVFVWPQRRITEAGGASGHTCVPLCEMLTISGRHHQACSEGEGMIRSFFDAVRL